MKEYRGLVLFPGDAGHVGLFGSLKASRMVMTVTAVAAVVVGHCGLCLLAALASHV